MPTRSSHRLALTVLAIAAAGCEVSQDQEVALGEQGRQEIERQMPIVRDPEASRYVSELGAAIAAKTARADLRWSFRIVDSPEVNAFALPGGFIYLNRGLVEKMRAMDELAGVLGHEIGHVVQRHSAEQMEKRTKTTVGIGIFCTLTGWCSDAIAQTAINVAGSAWFAKHSRLDEQEADSEAVVNVMRAGIDPDGIPALFEILLAERRARPGVVEGWFASHPLEEARVGRTKALIERIPAASREGLADDSPSFQAFKRRLQALPPSPAPRTLTGQ